MVFSSPVFLFLFLPVTLALWFAAYRTGTVSAQNAVLLFCSLVFYSYGGLQYLLLLAASVAVNWLCGIGMERYGGMPRRGIFLAGIIYNIAILVVFKYLGLLGDTLNAVFGGLSGGAVQVPVYHLPLPIGISFFTFQIMSYLIDVYRREVPVQRNIGRLALYIFLFPQLIAGPIVRYADIMEELRERKSSLRDIYEGAFRFACGFAKKILLANGVGQAADLAFGQEGGPGLVFAWIGVVCYTLQLYLDFWAYSDMAIGLGRIFGFHFMENFRDPYTARNVQDFWKRWHISLTSWFRNYVYIPLGGNRGGEGRTFRNIMIVYALTGIWHGASWNFLLWGLYHGFFQIAERKWTGRFFGKMPRIFGTLYADLVYCVSMVLFRAEGFGAALAYFTALFRRAALFVPGDYALFVCVCNRKFALVFIAAVFMCSPLYHRLHRFLQDHRLALLEDLGVLCAFFAAVCEMMASGYNPFIYFRF
ncbi:MAG: MBOAT family protein [Clostridium sp.]|nr:MBOAT family protein [Clostridium sp.]